MNDIRIGEKIIGEGADPFIIAEMSGNHGNSLERALKMVEKAAEAGVHALKLQTYTADTMTLNVEQPDFFVSENSSLWNGHYLHDLYKKAFTPWEWHGPIFKKCNDLGIVAFSTAFDETAVDFLEDLDIPIHKISSFENNYLSLIKKAASTKKPLIISTGMASITEIAEAVDAARGAGCKDLILLKCTSSYPASPDSCNLLTIPHMKELFNCHVGLSDHTLGIAAPIASVTLGASVIEKHFTLSRGDDTVDAAFSLEPSELKMMVEETQNVKKMLGRVHYGMSDGKEKQSLIFRRSIYVSDNIKSGDIITSNNVKVVRPGFGLHPKYFDMIIGKRARRDLKRGEAFSLGMLE